MDVRRLKPAEWEAFRAIRLQALAGAPEAFGSTHADEAKLSDAEWQERSDRPDRAIFVVDRPNGLVGLAIGAPAPDVPDTAELFSMWVAPEARHRGLGTALIDAVKAWASGSGYAALGLGVTTTNVPAITLYDQLGFTDSGDRYPLREGTGLMIQIMIVALRPSPPDRG